MRNYSTMSPAFEREKNIKALSYTAMVCGALLIIFFFAKWTLPQIPPPPFEEGIEVNLGNSDEGLGDEAPMIPGEPSASDEESYSPPQTSQPVAQNEQDIQTDENETDAPEISKPVTRPVITKKLPKNKDVVAKPKPNTTPVTNPLPKPPTPKAVYKGGSNSGPGGNNSDSYNNSRNQGIAGGKGDQGNPNGNPNSDSYKGNASSGTTGGVRIRSGLDGRRISRLPSFEDDFNQNATVAVDIKVNRDGTVTSASINLRGTSTTNANIRAIALRKARQLKLNAGSEDEQSGTILFEFKLRG